MFIGSHLWFSSTGKYSGTPKTAAFSEKFKVVVYDADTKRIKDLEKVKDVLEEIKKMGIQVLLSIILKIVHGGNLKIF